MTHANGSSRMCVETPRREGERVRWEGELHLPTGMAHRIYFEFSTPDHRPYPVRARPFLLAFLLPAMHAGAPLELDLPVDAVTRNNLMEWQEAMVAWNPKQLRVVPIVAPTEPEPERWQRRPDALTAFSGGVDSCFTVWRHIRRQEPALFRTMPLGAGMMVHGFDIPLAEEEIFESAWQRSRTLLAAFGLPAYRMATNLRSMDRVPGCEWGLYAHGIWLAAALSCFEPWFDQMLIPSTFSYPLMLFPWGSNPVTDPLFSSATTGYWHDGAAYSKLAKMQAIAGEPSVQRHLRVCWEGRQLDRNCGKCFKCIATKVCFQLSGVEHPEAFPNPCTLAEVAQLPVKHAANDWLLHKMSAEARRQGREPIARALDEALARNAAKKRRQQFKQTFRQWRRNQKQKLRRFIRI
jgi:hypothetical protein